MPKKTSLRTPVRTEVTSPAVLRKARRIVTLLTGDDIYSCGDPEHAHNSYCLLNAAPWRRVPLADFVSVAQSCITQAKDRKPAIAPSTRTNQYGCEPSEDVCLAHDEPLVGRSKCASGKPANRKAAK